MARRIVPYCPSHCAAWAAFRGGGRLDDCDRGVIEFGKLGDDSRMTGVEGARTLARVVYEATGCSLRTNFLDDIFSVGLADS